MNGNFDDLKPAKPGATDYELHMYRMREIERLKEELALTQAENTWRKVELTIERSNSDRARQELGHAMAEAARLRAREDELLGFKSDSLQAQANASALYLVAVRLQIALNVLQDAEAHYRLMHDTSPVKLDIGRAWDLMRRAGDRARKVLQEIQLQAEVERNEVMP